MKEIKKTLNFCKPYDPDSKYNKEVTEINVNGTDKDLIEIVLKAPNRVNVILPDGQQGVEVAQRLKTLAYNKAYTKNVYAMVPKKYGRPPQVAPLAHLAHVGIPYFFTEAFHDWQTLNYVIDTYHPSDVYVTGPICFDMAKVKNLCYKKDVSVRVVPNLVQSLVPKKSIRDFYVRPADLSTYDLFVDTWELADTGQDLDTVYEIYKEQKVWIGDLREVIPSIPFPIDDRGLSDLWGWRRLNCEQNCLKGGSCHLCDTLRELSQTISEKEVEFKEILDRPEFLTK